jgi:autotransporter-associated beta strand protein
VTATLDTQSYTQTVTGVIYGEDRVSTLVKLGTGMLVLDPGPTSGFTVSTFKVQAGTTYVRSGSNVVNIASGGAGSSGLWMNGGTLLVAGGELKTTGGGYVTTGNGMLIITNGVVNFNSANELLNAYGGNGTVTVSGSGVFDLKVLRISQTSANASANVVNVNTGGTIRLNNFYIDAASPQSGHVNFNGGTVVAKMDHSNFLGEGVPNWSNIIVYARAGGAVIDNNGFSISIKQSIYSGAAADGGLIKKGAGVLTLLNTNTYNGGTAVLGGTLKLGVITNTLWPAGNVLVASNAVFDVNAKAQSLAGLGGSGLVTNNSLLTVTYGIAPGSTNAIGTLTLATTPAALGGTLLTDVALDGSCDRLHVQGNLDLSALALMVADTGLLNKNKRYVIASCSGTLSNAFTSAPLPPRWNVKYDTANKQVYLIYNPGTLLRVQ